MCAGTPIRACGSSSARCSPTPASASGTSTIKPVRTDTRYSTTRILAVSSLAMRRSLIAGLVAAPVIALTTLAIVTSGSADAEGATLAAGKFRAYQPGATAITYDPVQVPAGARAAVVSTDLTNATVRLVVTGLQPNRSYGAHAHNNACGATGTDAGSHFQYLIDPEQPSVNPAYANPD